MIKKKGQPITGTNTEMKPRPGVLANQAKTSTDLQNRITKAPQPFTQTGGGATTPAGTGPKGATPGLEPKVRAGLQRTTPGAKALPSGGPVGQRKAINQSGQIGGRMGFPPPRRKRGDNGVGYSAKKGAAFYGE